MENMHRLQAIPSQMHDTMKTELSPLVVGFSHENWVCLEHHFSASASYMIVNLNKSIEGLGQNTASPMS